MRLLAALLLAAVAVEAQPVVRTSIDMLPARIERETKQKLYRAFYGTRGQINRINQRLRQIGGALKKKPTGEELKKLRAERTRLQKRIPALYGDMFKRFSEAGLDDADIKRLRRMPRGVLRDERYNHRLVLEAPDLTDAQRKLLWKCTASIDAAQRALHVQYKYFQGATKQLEPTLRRQLNGSFNTQRQQMERRFWKIAYYALTPVQMTAIRKHLSPRYGNIPQLEQQMYLLPDMSSSQATRIRALFREHESETAADIAEQRRFGKALRDRKIDKAARGALQTQAKECNERLYGLRQGFRKALKASLNKEQLAALHSRAPLLNVGDLYQGLRKPITEMAPSAAQNRRIATLRKELQSEQRKVRQKLGREMGGMRDADIGPESPQQMTMQMMQRRTQAKSLALVRATGHQVVIEVLTADQVSNWIVAPVLKP